MNEYQLVQLRAKAAELASALLDRKVGFLEGVRGMVALSAEFGDAERFEHFTPFIAVDSETDRFPVGEVRTRWSQDALRRVDKEVAENEQFYRPCIEAACRELISKWS